MHHLKQAIRDTEGLYFSVRELIDRNRCLRLIYHADKILQFFFVPAAAVIARPLIEVPLVCIHLLLCLEDQLADVQMIFFCLRKTSGNMI